MQVDEARNQISETSTNAYEQVLAAHERSKEFEKLSKDLTKEIQILSREKEAIEKQRTEAIKKHAKLELDEKDLREKITANSKAKVFCAIISYKMANLFLFLHFSLSRRKQWNNFTF